VTVVSLPFSTGFEIHHRGVALTAQGSASATDRTVARQRR